MTVMLGVHPLGCSFGIHGGKYAAQSVRSWKLSETAGTMGNAVSGNTAYNNRPAVVGRVPSRGVPARFMAARVNVSALQASPRSMVAAVQTAIVPTFRLDGGTIPRRNKPWRFQKPHILRSVRGANRPKNELSLFDGSKIRVFTRIQNQNSELFRCFMDSESKPPRRGFFQTAVCRELHWLGPVERVPRSCGRERAARF